MNTMRKLNFWPLALLTFASWGAQAQIATAPTFLPTAGTYASAQSVAISDTTPGAAIYYTTDGTTPTTGSTQYSAPITVGASETVTAIAVASGYTTSSASAAYVITTVSYAENFTGANTNNSWYYFKGACLTAGTTAATVSNLPGAAGDVAGLVPSCASMTASPYYWNGRTPLVGGDNNSGSALNLTSPTSTPDPIGNGALRFTNTGGQQAGSILSNFSFPLSTQGIQVTFVTETYEGDSGGGDGADGISFFLQDATQAPDLGATGGSLAYTCTNTNNDSALRASGIPRGYDGLIGAYVGVGIDEYGNFMNPGDNTASGANSLNGGVNFLGNRIGIRGAGDIAWSWLNANYPAYYPSTLSNTAIASAVQATCSRGVLYDANPAHTSTYTGTVVNSSGQTITVTSKVGNNVVTSSGATISLPDYQALAYKNLSGVVIANEYSSGARYRGNGTTSQLTSAYGVPISYNLKITTGGLLTLSYSYDGGASINVISGYNIINANGALPANVRFGFAGSDGGSTNIHEVMCFAAAPQASSQSSAAGNQKQSQPVETGTQVYFASYDPTSWGGDVVSDALYIDSSNNSVYIAPSASWDASCGLTAIASGSSCASTGVAGPNTSTLLAPTSRVALTWSGSTGIQFSYGTLPAAEKTAIDTETDGTISTTAYRANYLLGDRSNEQNSSGTGAYTATGYRDRVSVLGDIIDSSPTWVGPPLQSYPNSWSDSYLVGTPGDPLPENATGAQTYSAFISQENARINVVYAGSNDGFLHGFRSGYYNNGTYVGTGSGTSFVGTQNDGQELLAYMPGAVINQIQTAAAADNDYSDPQYGHKFEVDATPGTGDVFYNGAWHTILVGGLGAGGADIFALDITNPANSSITTDPVFATTNASTLVLGDWTPSTLTCAHSTTTSCGTNMGNTYGTPQIRRFHNGQWGAVFGNGFGSSTGDAGIFVMLLNATTGAPSFYYLGTGKAGQQDGIAYVSTADLDGDHITDYVYAGDLLGNVWRFDLTNTDPTLWAVTKNSGGTALPVYTTASGQPITTKLSIVSVLASPYPRVMVLFGTGQQTPLTNSSPITYLTTQQSLYGIWDWNLGTWNSLTTVQKYAALTSSTSPAAPTTGLTAGSTTPSNLIAQSMSTVTFGGVDYRIVTSNAVCYAGTTGCGSTIFGWYLPLTYGAANPADVNSPLQLSSSTNPPVYEQVIFNPIVDGDTFIVNTVIPSASSLTNCFSASAGGFTMAIDPGSGGSFPKSVFVPPATATTTSPDLNGIALNGTGSVFLVTTNPVCAGANCGGGCVGAACAPACVGAACGTPPPCTPGVNNFIITQTESNKPTSTQANLQCNLNGSRLTWIQRR